MKLVNLFSVLLFISVLAGNSYAGDEKVMPGLACQPELASLDTSRTSSFASYISNNDATNTLHVTCPVVRDNISNINGTDWSYVRVRGNTTTGTDVSCTLYSYDSLGGFLESDFAQGGAAGNVSLSLDVDSSGFGGFYSYHCVLPPGGRIYSYRVSEPD